MAEYQDSVPLLAGPWYATGCCALPTNWGPCPQRDRWVWCPVATRRLAGCQGAGPLLRGRRGCLAMVLGGFRLLFL